MAKGGQCATGCAPAWWLFDLACSHRLPVSDGYCQNLCCRTKLRDHARNRTRCSHRPQLHRHFGGRVWRRSKAPGPARDCAPDGAALDLLDTLAFCGGAERASGAHRSRCRATGSVRGTGCPSTQTSSTRGPTRRPSCRRTTQRGATAAGSMFRPPGTACGARTGPSGLKRCLVAKKQRPLWTALERTRHASVQLQSGCKAPVPWQVMWTVSSTRTLQT